MKKTLKKDKKLFIEECATLGFMVGSLTWFAIYFPKKDLYFGKLLLYMTIGLIIGGLIGKIIVEIKNKKIYNFRSKICVKCHFNNSDDAEFYQNCGEKILNKISNFFPKKC